MSATEGGDDNDTVVDGRNDAGFKVAANNAAYCARGATCEPRICVSFGAATEVEGNAVVSDYSCNNSGSDLNV